MAEILPLFSTPVYIDSFDPKDFDFSVVEKIPVREVCQGNGYVSEHQYVLDLPEMKKIREAVFNSMRIYLHDVLQINKKLELKHVNSWTCFYEKGNFSDAHIHSNSLYSGVFYTHVDKDSSPLILSVPRQIPTYSTSTIEPDIAEYNIFNSKKWRIHPMPGTIIIFPSHLTHSVSPSNSNTLRRCVAFNFFLKGKFGVDPGANLSKDTQLLEIN